MIETRIGERRIVLQRVCNHYVIGVASGASAARAVLVTASKARAEAMYQAIVASVRRTEKHAEVER